MESIVDALRKSAGNHPDKPCVIGSQDDVYTYCQFETLVRRFATVLSRTVRPSDRILLHLPNSAEYLALYLACLWVGATVVPVDAQAKAQTVEYAVRDCEPALVVEPETVPSLLCDNPCSGEPVKANPTALILYTSGTTGPPKGAMVTHLNLLFTARSICDWADINGDDRELTTLRLSHSFGLGHFHCYMLQGGTFYFERDASDLQGVLHRIKHQHITSFPATPALIHILLKQHRREFAECCKDLRYMIINSASMPEELTRDLMQTLPNMQIYMYYGLTEASRSTHIHYNSHPDKLASVGRPPEGVHVRIERGEIQVSGVNVSPGYWRGEQTGEWFSTGDTGYLDDEGFLYVTGRLKEQVNIDGIKCNPWEVERALLKHPAVADCAVIGLPHPITNEQVVACVVLRGESPSRLLANALRRHCLEHVEARIAPTQIRFVARIPKTDSGKPQRLLLRTEQMEGAHVR